MGGKESKQSCINYEDAVKRVSELELLRLKDAFKKSAGVGRPYLSRNAFQQDVLCEGVPSNITELLYTACGGTAKGISFKDLLCGLVLFTRGTDVEKTRFLWNLYCNDGGTYIIKSEFIKLTNLRTFEGQSLFGQSDRVTFDQYQAWLFKHRNTTILSKWLLLDTNISLTSELETPTFYQSLAGVTHLEEKDIGDLEKEFWRFKNCSLNGQIDINLLGPLISPPIPKNALVGLFNAFDENRDGHIDFKELCCGVSAACRGPCVERTRFCFKIFDIDRDGILNHDETIQMVNVLLFVAKENRNSNLYKDLTRENAIEDIIAFIIQKNGQESENPKNDEAGIRNLSSENVSLTAEDFMMWSVESNIELIQPFLDLTFEVCHIVFGLWPQCRHTEYDIVRGWLKREEKRKYRVGQFWYLISRDWWLSWLQYTQSLSTICKYCKRVSLSQRNCGIDEALVCDESFNSNNSNFISIFEEALTVVDNRSIESNSSDISMGQISQRPGPIDNINLITPNQFKNIRTLTGEGGHLKRDTPLVQNHDFELVPKSLWNAFNRWYGDSLPLPRQVIQAPSSTEAELELYPLKLQILLHQYLSQNNSINTWSGISGGYGAMASCAAISSSSSLQLPKRYLAYTAAFSCLATVRQINDFLCEQLRLKPEVIRLWHIPAGSVENVALLLDEDNVTLREMLIKDNDQILLEIRNKDLTWPEELSSLSLGTVAVIADRRLTRTSILSVHAPGATGLHNLGNTCFMNAALQVLFNTQPLAQYFRRNMHHYELNDKNKLGTKGFLALRYGDLLNEVWTATTRSVAPLKLRYCVTKYAPQFAGGGQHDSQELLEWLLDALHEDLNRVMVTGYTELKDSNGRPDKVVATEAWMQHHARNQSIIIDLFYGQLKSKVRCLCCDQESVRFDPFNLLSLPLPVENYIYLEVLVILLDGTVPIKYGLRLNSESKYSDLKRKLSELCFLNHNFMIICEILNSRIKQILSDELKIKRASAKELYVYQLPEECSDRSHSSSTLGLNIEKGLKDIQRNSAALVSTGQDSLFSYNALSANQPILRQMQFPKSDDKVEEMLGKQNERDVRHFTHEEYEDDDEQVATKQISNMNRSPDDNHVHELHERVSSTKLLHTESNTCSESLESQTNWKDKPLNSSTKTDRIIIMDASSAIENCNSKCINNEGWINSTELSSHACIRNGNDEINNEANMIFFKRDNDGKGSSIFSNMNIQQYKVGQYLTAVHRKITRQDSYFLSHHKTRPSLFGVPLIIPNNEGGTHKDLYCAVWLQVNRLLSPLPASMEQANHAADCDDSLGYDFPFTLRAVKSDGLSCALCPWSNFCRGCEIPCNNDFLLQSSSVNTSNSSSPKMELKNTSFSQTGLSKQIDFTCKNIEEFIVAIDWDPTALHLRYQSTLERLWTDHESVEICRQEQIEPVDLNHCLEAFTSEEKLEQWYYCSHCKGKKPATKKLQIWKLPPILIVHLKRFNCVNGKWVKSQKVVHFPFDNFDPTPYLAAVPQETIMRHRELSELKGFEDSSIQEMNKPNIKNSLDDIGKYDIQMNENQSKNFCNGNNINVETIKNNLFDNSIHMNNLTNAQQNKRLDNCSNIVIDYNKRDRLLTFKEDDKTLLDNEPIHDSQFKNVKAEKRKRLTSTSLTKSPIIDGEFEDFHQHKLKNGHDSFDPKYKLYAVVSHSGMLNGGHYVSYAANQNGSWYYYNDSSCREITGQPHIDPSAAYLLFYERHGLDYEPYLPSIDEKTPTTINLGVDIDENDSDLKRVCVIS